MIEATGFLLGNLSDFDPQRDRLPSSELLAVDQWALAQTKTFIDAVTQAYQDYEFHRVYQLLINFCTVTLSSTYHDLLKEEVEVSHLVLDTFRGFAILLKERQRSIK